MSPLEAVALAVSVAVLARLWQLYRDQKNGMHGHKHAWESIAIGPWREAVDDGAHGAHESSICDRAADDVHEVAYAGGTVAQVDDDSGIAAYKWFRAELVCCRCGVTHERFQVVTEKGMWVTE